MYRRVVKESKFCDWLANPRETALLRATWTEDFEELFTLGSKIYLNAFEGEHGEACKSLFLWVPKYEAAGINYAEQSEFRIQALRLVQTIAKVLDRVDDVVVLERYLYKLGHRHVHYLPVWLDPMFWDGAVQTGLNDRMHSLTQLSPEDRARAIVIWHDIVEYIFIFVKEGFYDGLKATDRYSV